MSDEKPRVSEQEPSPVKQVGDRGLAGSAPVTTTEEEEREGALGGRSATRSGTAPTPEDAERGD